MHLLKQISHHTNTHTLAFTLSPKQLQYWESTLTGERTSKDKSQPFLGRRSANRMAAAECNRQLSQSRNGRGKANSSKSQKLKQLEIEINQSDPADWIHWCVVFEALLKLFLCSQTCRMLMTLLSNPTFIAINTEGNPNLHKINVLQDRSCFLSTLKNWKQVCCRCCKMMKSQIWAEQTAFFFLLWTDLQFYKSDCTSLLSAHICSFVCVCIY